MRIYIDPYLCETILVKTSSKALRNACFSFCSYLYEASVRFNNHWTPYSSRKGQQIYTPQIYTQMIRLLKEVGAIEQTRSYRIGETPKLIRLTGVYHKIIPRELNAPALELRLCKVLNEKIPNTNVHKWLRKVYQEKTLFSSNAWIVISNFPYQNDDQETSYRYHYDQFIHKASLYSIGSSGRVTYVPNLIPQALRRTILIDGDPIVEVDVVSSQPRLALTLLSNNHPEYVAFKELLDSGTLYEVVAGWTANIWKKDELKPQFFRQILYGDKHAHHTYPLWQEFQARYPHFASIIEREKRTDRRVLPIKLQSIETQIMLNGVVDECATLQIPVINIHDGIGTKLKDVNEVSQLIHKHWTGITGSAPKIRIGGEFT